MRYEYRISKYDPKNRDLSGYYTRKEWTHFAQVGTTIGRRKLTLAGYRHVEDAYLRTISEMLVEAGISRLNVARFRVIPRTRKAIANVRVGRTIDLRAAVRLSRLELRGFVDAAFNVPRKMYLHFGFDYYVYLGLSQATPSAIAMARRRKIFVEPMASPYRRRRSARPD